jgi:MFS family permease
MDLGGALLGFALLGQFLSEGRTDLALLAIAGMTVITFIVTVVLVREPKHVSPTTSPNRVTIADAFRLNLNQHRAFASVVLSRFLFLLGTYMVGRFLLFFVADRLHLDPMSAAEQTGSLLFSLTLLTALGALAAGWAADRFGRIPLMLLGAALSAVGVLLIIVAENQTQILLFGGLMSLGSAAFAGANWALTADLVPASESARFMALANFGTAGAAAAAGLLGPIVDWANGLQPGTGYSVLFGFATLAFVGSALALRGIVLSQPKMIPGHQTE